MPRTLLIPVFTSSLLLLAAACGGGEWAGEGWEEPGPGGWPWALAGAWEQKLPECPSAQRRWEFYPPATFVESLEDPFGCARSEGQWFGGMSAGAGGLLDLTCDGPDPFRRLLAAVLGPEGAERLNVRAFADEGEGICFFRHRWQTHIDEEFSDRRLGLRLCFSQALPQGQRPVMVDVQLWLYEDLGTNAPANTGAWNWTFALQTVEEEDGARLFWPEGMSREGLSRDWADFVTGAMPEGGRLSLAAAQEMLPLWRWSEGRLVEDAPAAWMRREE